MNDYYTLEFFVIVTLVLLVLSYIWQKKWLLYYSLQFPGPKTLPLIGVSFKLARALNDDELSKRLQQVCESQKPVFKVWIANDLYIVNSQPEDLEILMNNFLNKDRFYELFDKIFNTSILTSSGDIWRERRKQMNPTFNSKILNSFHDTFVKNAKKLVKTLNDASGQEQTNLLSDVWKCIFDNSLETLTGFDSTLIKDRYELIACIIRFERILLERFTKFWLLIDFIFQMSHLKKKLTSLKRTFKDFGEKILEIKGKQMEVGITDLENKRFLNHLINLHKQQVLGKRELLDETVMMMGVASETSSVAITNVMLVLGLYQEVQHKVYEEICMVSNIDENSDLIFEEMNRMDYLERVIKETLRLLNVVPFVLRSIDKNLRLGSFLYPAGSTLIIPIGHLHRKPDLWPDPLKFDPDRFLPEQVAKRHRCAYIPFSFGPRNCIGRSYAMRSIKIMLAYIVKNFKITALNYSSLEELEIELKFVAVPKGYRLLFERRTDINNN